MTKSSINNAQDAMGYRTMTQAAHSSYMVLHQAGRVAKGGERRLKGVARALEED
jgi:hypothetical protein